MLGSEVMSFQRRNHVHTPSHELATISNHQFQFINFKSSILNHQFQIINSKSSISNHQFQIVNRVQICGVPSTHVSLIFFLPHFASTRRRMMAAAPWPSQAECVVQPVLEPHWWPHVPIMIKDDHKNAWTNPGRLLVHFFIFV